MPQLLILITLGVVVGVLAFAIYQSDAFRRDRMFKKVRALPIGETPDSDEAQVVGTVVLDQEVKAPLSGRRCAYWHVVIGEHRGEDGERVLVDEHGGADFTLRDQDAIAWVETGNVEPVLRHDAYFRSGSFHDATPELEAFLKSRGLSSRGWIFNKTLGYREAIIEEGERVAVIGRCQWERDPNARPEAGTSYRSAEYPERLRVSAGVTRGKVVISDEPALTEAHKRQKNGK